MNTMIVDSRVFGGSVRSKPSFGNTVIGYLNQTDEIEVTGKQVGDRWIPSKGPVGW